MNAREYATKYETSLQEATKQVASLAKLARLSGLRVRAKSNGDLVLKDLIDELIAAEVAA